MENAIVKTIPRENAQHSRNRRRRAAILPNRHENAVVKTIPRENAQHSRNRRRRAAILPNPHPMLHQQADTGDADPAAKSHDDGLAACFDQFYNIGV